MSSNFVKILSNGLHEVGRLEWDAPVLGATRMRLEIMGDRFTYDGVDLIDCMHQAWECALSKKCFIPINGCRPNFFCSRMQRQSSLGIFGYLTEMGREALPTQRVETFALAGVLGVASLDEQKMYYKKWISSLST